MRYLLVGLGNIGAKRQAVLGDRCIATVDPVNLAADYRRYDECDQDRYDAAILAVPNVKKVSLLKWFLQRGKSVLVEKPLILDAPTAELLRQLAERSRTIWYTSYNLRFEPHVLAIKRDLEAGTLGRIYRVHMFYGNGSAGAVKGTWRDDRYGVLADLASHLIDLTGFFFPGCFGARFRVLERHSYELSGPDHCVLAVENDASVVIECSVLSWENRWCIEVTGERGALVMNGLTKWGPSHLQLKRRQFPSGPPDSTCYSVPGVDTTWAADLQHFEDRVAKGESSFDNDVWISRTVIAAAEDREAPR